MICCFLITNLKGVKYEISIENQDLECFFQLARAEIQGII